jgi:polyisoprenyl-phosphate glycosyltransferase
MKLISIVTPCYNEQGNVEEAYRRIKELFATLPQYRYEHLFIDNASTDATASILRRLAAEDQRVKVILNSRNFGPVRSQYHAILQAKGDAVVPFVADLQDPVELIPRFLKAWEEGAKIVMGVKNRARESSVMFALRKMYYNLANQLSEVSLTTNFNGFGLFDQAVLNILREIEDPYPYFRGLIAELGFSPVKIEYEQPRRERGISSSNFYVLYDVAMLGITSHSKVPLRTATMLGFAMSALSLLVGLGYLVAKLIFWQVFSMGMAPVVVGIFFFASVQLFFTGILGEYIGAIHRQVLHRPLVIEKERINFNSSVEGVSHDLSGK